jgi:cell wall-associated NlpC family hydrolase
MSSSRKQIVGICVLSISALLMTGCGSTPEVKKTSAESNAYQIKLAQQKKAQQLKLQKARQQAKIRKVTPAQRAVWIAQKQLNIPYLWGGTSPTKGFDCSGLVQYSYKKNNVKLPRTAAQQYAATKPVHPTAAKSGDLVFFKNTGKRRGITHVGLYLGNGKFIHAPRKGKTVEITKVDHRYWGKHIAGFRRVAANTLGSLTKTAS